LFLYSVPFGTGGLFVMEYVLVSKKGKAVYLWEEPVEDIDYFDDVNIDRCDDDEV